MTHGDELAAHVRRLGNHELNELLLQAPQAQLHRPGRGRARPAGAGRWAGSSVRARSRCGWLDGGGLCAAPAAGHPDPRPRPRRSGGLPGLDPGRRPGPAQRDLELAPSRGCGRGAGLGDAGQWGALSGPGRLCPFSARLGPAPAAGRAASGCVRPVAGCRLPAGGVGRMTAGKRCPRCGQLKPAEEFYRRRRGRRLSSYCQLCARAAASQAQSSRRQDPAAAEGLRAVDRVRQRRRRALGRRGGDCR
jgi:hypothetical protein